MGYKHMPWVLEQDQLNTAEKMVLTVLTMHAHNERRSTWVSIGTICKEAGFSKNSRASVRRALDVLRDRGLVSWSERYKDNEQTTHLYTVHWSATARRVEGVGAHNTYPGAQDTYPQVFTTPTPGAQSTTDEEPNGEVLSGEAEWGNDAPPPGADSPSPQAPRARDAAAADPIGPEWYHSDDRKKLIFEVQRAAREAQTNRESALCMIERALWVSLAIDADYIFDLDWYPPSKCTSAFEAAIWMNKLLGWLRNEIGEPLNYPPSEEAFHA